MARGDRWWNEPPLWAWVTMVAGAVAIIVLLPLALGRTAPGPGDSARAAGSGPAPTGTPSGSAEPTGEDGSARVVVLGDSDTGGAGQPAWPELLRERLPGVEVDAVTTGDSGYVSTVPGEPTLPDLVSGTDLANADVVVLSGSRFDAAGISDQVSAAAQEAITAVREQAPDAGLVVIGPVWPGGGPPAGVRNNRDVIRSTAAAASVRFVDPLTDGWLVEDEGLVGEDAVHLTKAGQAALADLVEPVVVEALAAVADASPGG